MVLLPENWKGAYGSSTTSAPARSKPRIPSRKNTGALLVDPGYKELLP